MAKDNWIRRIFGRRKEEVNSVVKPSVVEKFCFSVFIARIEGKILKFIKQTPESLKTDIARYRYSMVLSARREVDEKNMTYYAKHLGYEVRYDHNTKILTVTLDDDEWEMSSKVSIRKYKLNDSNEFELIEER